MYLKEASSDPSNDLDSEEKALSHKLLFCLINSIIC
jgi:hypothetical protein